MLDKEIMAALEVFNLCGMTEEQQKKVLENGLNFNFSYGDPNPQGLDTRMSFFELAKFLKLCKDMGVEIDIDDLLKNPYSEKYKNLVIGFKTFHRH